MSQVIEVCESLDKVGRLAQLIEDCRAGRLHRRSRHKRHERIRGCFFSRILDVDGSVARDWDYTLNGATYEGMNSVLDVAFRNQTQITAWYASLIAGSGYSAVSVNDTAASHAGWTEYTAYTQGVRQTWSPGAAASGVITNASAMVFTIGGSAVTIQGTFLSSVSTLGASTGKLHSTAPKSSPDSVTAGQSYQAFYEIDLTALN